MYLSLFYQPIQYETASTHLFEHTMDNIKKGISSDGPKLVLYSAHDTTMGLVLRTLNLTNTNCIYDRYINGVDNSDTCISDYPKYASTIVYEIYKHDDNSHTFQIVFNGEVKKIPFCNWQT